MLLPAFSGRQIHPSESVSTMHEKYIKELPNPSSKPLIQQSDHSFALTFTTRLNRQRLTTHTLIRQSTTTHNFRSKMLGPPTTYVPLTRSNLRMHFGQDCLRWIDHLTALPVGSSPVLTSSNAPQIYALRCPGDCPRLPRRWKDARMPRLGRDSQTSRSRLSPLCYEAYENRFGRFRR